MIGYWETYKGGPTPERDKNVHITLSAKGVILLNRTAYKLLGSPRAVCLYFNKANSKIGISSAHPEIAWAFHIRDKVTYFLINAMPFCRHYGIRVEKTQQFVRPDIDNDGILHLDLTTTVTVGRVVPKRSGRAQNRGTARS
jgi:hypothetical protein